MDILTQLYLGIINYQYLILFLLITIEGPIATVVSGFLVAQGFMDIYLVYPLALVADLFGDSIYYLLGRYGRHFVFKIFNFNKKRIKNIENHFTEHGGKTILIGKISHGVGAIFLFVAGIAHISYRKFLFYNTIGTIPKTAILILIGYFFGNSYLRIGKYLDLFGLFTLALGFIILIVYLKFSQKIKQKQDL